MSHVTFPGLGLEFDINAVAFRIGGYDIYWYGILIALGAFIGVVLAAKNADRFGIIEDKMYDVVLIGAVIALLGGRAFYILFNADYKVDTVKEFFNLRGGGTAFYGILIGALVGSFVVCRLEKINYRCFLDDCALGFLIGQGIGRWGNFMNQELFGTNTSLPWGMYSDTIARYIERNSLSLYVNHGIVLNDGPVHPTFLYESLWCFLGVFVISRVIKKRRFDGQVFLTYLLWNGIGRGFTESLRTDALFLGRIRISQLVCVTLALVSAAILFFTLRKIKYQGDDEYLKCYALTEDWQKEKEAYQAKQERKKNRGAAETKEAEDSAEETIEEACGLKEVLEDAIEDAEEDSAEYMALLAAAGLDEEEGETLDVIEDVIDENAEDIEVVKDLLDANADQVAGIAEEAAESAEEAEEAAEEVAEGLEEMEDAIDEAEQNSFDYFTADSD